MSTSIKSVLGFFTGSDEIVLENLGDKHDFTTTTQSNKVFARRVIDSLCDSYHMSNLFRIDESKVLEEMFDRYSTSTKCDDSKDDNKRDDSNDVNRPQSHFVSNSFSSLHKDCKWSLEDSLEFVRRCGYIVEKHIVGKYESEINCWFIPGDIVWRARMNEMQIVRTKTGILFLHRITRRKARILDEDEINTVMVQAEVDREKAVEALLDNGNIVDAILELTP